MNVSEINECLLRGETDRPGVLPHLEALRRRKHVFRLAFGLDELPEEPGVLFLRGPRQFGKSTWLEGALQETVAAHGPGSALYLNGDEVRGEEPLREKLSEAAAAFPVNAGVRRLFVDEITVVAGWQNALKRVLDAGELRRVLVVTTGSKAADLRHGAERFPGRKGRLDRTTYLFTPLTFAEFRRGCGAALGKRTWIGYLLSGGCPLAAAELAAHGRLPEFVPTIFRDWILGESAASGRPRASLLAVLDRLLLWGGAPLGQAKLAREAGLANNTVAAAYVELLADLCCLGVSQAWDPEGRVRLMRRPAKYHFICLAAATAWHPARLRSVDDWLRLPEPEQGKWLEWLVAQELWRRAAIRGDESPEQLTHWQSPEHELDFVLDPNSFLEVKRGRTSALEFAWFPKVFPKARLTVVGKDRFETDRVRGVTVEDFLEDDEG